MAVTRIKQFFSRKNRASLVDMGGGYCVSKEFVMGDAELEWRILKKCYESGLRVPRPMGFENSTILMEYIDGGPMANRPCISVQQCRGLAKWLHGFHAIFPGMKRGDAILRNFLEKDGDIYGIDFEEAGPGDQLEDVSMLCASILTEDPIFSREKGRCTRALIETYSELREEDLYGPCINLIRGDLFAIFNRWKAYRGRIDEDLLQWIGFYQTVI